MASKIINLTAHIVVTSIEGILGNCPDYPYQTFFQSLTIGSCLLPMS